MKALSDCRVLDLGIITAGAATSAVLADFGAEVIKVESPSYRDPFRRWLAQKPADARSDLPPFFRATNRGKLGLSLDLKDPRGRDAFLRLVSSSDVVVENFRRGVLDKLDLGFEVLRVANPDIILASISSQGETGPDANYVSYGSTLEAVAGLAWITGYAGGEPTISGVNLNYPDQVVALFASAMIMTAWRRRLTGQGGGVHLDMSQRELTSFLAGEAFVAAGGGLDVRPQGNAQAPYLLQDCFAAANGGWVAVSARGDEPGLGPDGDPGLDGLDAESLRRSVAELVAGLPAAEAAARLAGGGIAAAEVLKARDVFGRRGEVWAEALQRAPDGAVLKGFAAQFVNAPLTITRDAPVIGADSRDILRRVGGLADEDIEALIAAGVVESALSLVP